MYTDEDLNLAVEKGVFTSASVDEFRNLLSSLKNSPSADEENFRLIGGFNDIFIVVACALLLFSTLWVLNKFTGNFGISILVFSAMSWLLAEFFVLKRKMALPAIALLIAFVGSLFIFFAYVFKDFDDISIILAAGLSAIAAFLHWLRFKVPITVAAGTLALSVLFISVFLIYFPDSEDWMLYIIFSCGVMTFIYAMYWDSSDTQRTTRNSDVAFWLHLLSAPLIIHPVFSRLGLLDGDDSLISMIIVVLLYMFMTTVSIAIDRRAFMLSSLIYVVFALSSLFKTVGAVGSSFALTGVFMGAALLLLSAYWHKVRLLLVGNLPQRVQTYLPDVKNKKISAA